MIETPCAEGCKSQNDDTIINFRQKIIFQEQATEILVKLYGSFMGPQKDNRVGL